ncbi:MAG TPA: 16S rRNA (cytosine(1402)-N(4))-methyltransferase RsmH [Gemmatimonadaceae bacterium]|nr:16S rRNA (cytosine(1402)-N(4))-methyltransferase RsmH [Gemmatimonadaceae bacterium]
MTASDAVTGRWDSQYHAPVMVEEVVDLLKGAREVLDCTLGGGGHSEALLAAGASVTALDQDEAAINEARKRLAAYEAAGRFRALRGNFSDVDQLPELQQRQFAGILADLGVSSHQIDADDRGFSFRPGALLDMRMDSRATTTGADLLNTLDEAALTRLFREYGDEPRASRLAREVLRRRENRPMKVSDDLVGAIRGSFGARSGPSDFARLFQAVRIAVNDELGALERALPLLRNRLAPNGVLAVIAYHSGEDRIVKNAFRDWSRDCVCPPRQLQCTCGGKNSLGELVTRKAIKADAEEIEKNSRSRSARLRAWRKAA